MKVTGMSPHEKWIGNKFRHTLCHTENLQTWFISSSCRSCSDFNWPKALPPVGRQEWNRKVKWRRAKRKKGGEYTQQNMHKFKGRSCYKACIIHRATTTAIRWETWEKKLHMKLEVVLQRPAQPNKEWTLRYLSLVTTECTKTGHTASLVSQLLPYSVILPIHYNVGAVYVLYFSTHHNYGCIKHPFCRMLTKHHYPKGSFLVILTILLSPHLWLTLRLWFWSLGEMWHM